MKSQLALELQRQRSRMYRVALRIVGCREQAQEVVQIASLKSWQQIDRFEGRSSLASWLFRITWNAAHDQLRQTRRAPMSLSQTAERALEGNSTDTRCRDLEDRELYLLAMEYIEKLPDDCRETFILSQLDGYSYQQIAEIQQMPPGTVASRIHRAKQILRQQLQRHC